MKQSQVIVTGATGFVGQHLIPLLLQKNFEVIAMGRDQLKARQFDWVDKVKFVSLDYHKAENKFEPKQGAGLIHLAWQGLPNYTSPFHYEENLPKNYEFIKGMVASGVSKVLAIGTCFEYGLQFGPLSASMTAKPNNAYAQAKDSLRQHLDDFQKQTNFTFQWARLFYMYGQGQNPKSILAQLDTAIENGDPTFNMSGGEQLRDYLPIEEVALQLLAIFEKNESGVFNVCSGVPISIRRLVENRIHEKNATIKMNLGYYPYPEFEPMAFWGEK